MADQISNAASVAKQPNLTAQLNSYAFISLFVKHFNLAYTSVDCLNITWNSISNAVGGSKIEKQLKSLKWVQLLFCHFVVQIQAASTAAVVKQWQ